MTGSHEVRGSIPLGSTNILHVSNPSPLTAHTFTHKSDLQRAFLSLRLTLATLSRQGKRGFLGNSERLKNQCKNSGIFRGIPTLS
jgi:hypothetical protein